MKIEFLKDHIGYAKGGIIEGHPNADYLIRVGVAKEVELHTITEEDLINNPELVGEVEVGEVVELGPLCDAEGNELPASQNTEVIAPLDKLKDLIKEPKKKK
jgi:hypothetical protein